MILSYLVKISEIKPDGVLIHFRLRFTKSSNNKAVKDHIWFACELYGFL